MSKKRDITYYYVILNLWSLVEVAFGILAACLPHSPNFFKSLKGSILWSGFKKALHLYTQSNTTPSPTGTPTAERKIGKSRDGLSSFNALFKEYNILPADIELTTTLVTDGKESNTEANHWTENPQDLESMRTIHTTTTQETGLAPPMPTPP